MTAPYSRLKAMRFASLITTINVLVASGFSIAGLVRPQSILPPGDAPTEAPFTFAMYAAARTIPLALISLVAIYRRSTAAVLILGLLVGVIQFVDASVGILQRDPGKFAGPMVIAILQFFAICMLRKSMDKPIR